MSEPAIILFSTADWDNPFWTNKQHVAVELAKRGYNIFYIESVGLRAPTASSSDLSRVFKRLGKAVRPPRCVGARVRVWSPLVLPLQKFALVRLFNRVLFNTTLSFWLMLSGWKAGTLWTYNPMTTAFLDLRRFSKIVYHCVDEIKAQPGMPSREIERLERELLVACSVCFVTASALLDERRALQANIHYFSNVADFDHFSKAEAFRARGHSFEPVKGFRRPRIAFVGAISSYKVDFPLVEALSKAFPEASFVLAGKVGEGEPGTDASALAALPNVHLIGPVDYALLPELLGSCDVAMLPARLNDYTRGMFPMKFFEYLAAGLPVVSTDLPALSDEKDVALVARDQGEFVEALTLALAGGGPSHEIRLAKAKLRTYSSRTDAMLKITGEL